MNLSSDLIRNSVVGRVKIKRLFMFIEKNSENRVVFVYTLSDPKTLEIRYVGITCDINRRYKDHLRFSKIRNTHVYSWIRGLDEYPIINIIDKCSVKDFPSYEQYYISLYKEIGCNLTNHTLGGEGSYGLKHSEESRKKMSLSRTGESNHFFGKKHTDESKRIMSEIDRSGAKNSMFNKKHKDETKNKMSVKKIGIYNGSKNPRAKKIFQYELDGKTLIREWIFAKECSDALGMSRGNLSFTSKFNTNKDLNCMDVPYKVVYGYIFKFH